MGGSFYFKNYRLNIISLSFRNGLPQRYKHNLKQVLVFNGIESVARIINFILQNSKLPKATRKPNTI